MLAVLSVFALAGGWAFAGFFLCLSLSGTALALLHRLTHRIEANVAHRLADAAMLLPLVALWL
jgi:hypothetical protein